MKKSMTLPGPARLFPARATWLPLSALMLSLLSPARSFAQDAPASPSALRPATFSPDPRWMAEGEAGGMTGIGSEEPILHLDAPASRREGRQIAREALAALREVAPKIADAVQGGLLGKNRPVPAWAEPHSDAARKLEQQPLTRGEARELARPFFDRLHEAAPGWLEWQYQLQMKYRQWKAVMDGNWWYPWPQHGATAADDDPAAVITRGELLRPYYTLNFTSEDEKSGATDGIPSLWKEAVVHADNTGRWRETRQITPLNAKEIGAKSPAGPPPRTLPLHIAAQIDRRLAGKKAAVSLPLFLDYQENGKRGIFKRNPGFWAADLAQQLTCLPAWNSMDPARQAGVLITRRHLLIAQTSPLDPGTVVTFVTTRDKTITRKVVTTRDVPASLLSGYETRGDLAVVLLDADLPPEITPCLLPPDNALLFIPSCLLQEPNQQRVPVFPFIPALGVNHLGEGFVNQIFTIATPDGDPQTSNRWWTGFSAKSTDPAAQQPQRQEFQKPVSARDEPGNPDFFLVNDKLMLAMIWSGQNSAAGEGSGGDRMDGLLFWHPFWIGKAIEALDADAKIPPGAYQPGSVDLSGFMAFQYREAQ